MVKEELPEDIVNKHFTPSYNPWDQRICLIPNSDFFESIKAKTSSVVTDHIEKFEEKGDKVEIWKLSACGPDRNCNWFDIGVFWRS